MIILIGIACILAILSLIISKAATKMERGSAMPVSGFLWMCVAIGFGAFAAILILFKLLLGI